MSRPDESFPARAAAVWPSASLRRLRFAPPNGSETLNTPFRRTLVYLLARTRGGRNRCRILKLLQQTGPLNANQIAGALDLHYTTVKHHLDKLLRDDAIASSPRGEPYGATFFLTYQMERNATLLDEILPALEAAEEAAPRVATTAETRRAVSQ